MSGEFESGPKPDFDDRRFPASVVGTLVSSNTLQFFPCPRGTPHPEWPAWATPEESFTGLRTDGTVRYVGQDPYTLPTQWAVDLERLGGETDFHLPDEVIDLRAWSDREALQRYVPNENYKDWLLHGFLPKIGEQAHIDAVCASLDNLPWQFSIFDPNQKVPDDEVRRHLAGNNPNNTRYALAMSFLRYEATDHPKIILAHALLQGSFGPYLDHLETAITQAPISDMSKNIGRQVIKGPLEQLRSFTVYAVPFLLALLERKDILQRDPPPTDQEADRLAISQAWEALFIRSLLRRDLSSGHYMRCPGASLLNYIRKQGLVVGLYDFVDAHQNTSLLKALLKRAGAVAKHAMDNQDFYHNYYRGEEAIRRQDVRDGKGPFY